tara:strand:- start:1877 stop:2287 length:411 start_codon:yes stop_codon:yes gene_type:complete
VDIYKLDDIKGCSNKSILYKLILKNGEMEIELLIYCITAIVSALGIKEVWSIWKRKIELKNQILKKNEITKDQITSKVIDELKNRIRSLESKIDDLLTMNKECAVKLARLEERVMLSAKKNSNRKTKKTKSLSNNG